MSNAPKQEFKLLPSVLFKYVFHLQRGLVAPGHELKLPVFET